MNVHLYSKLTSSTNFDFEIIPAENTNVLYSSEMIAPLDVYHNTAGVTVPNEERQRRYRHHRTQHKHHRHRHPGFQFDPSNAEVNFHVEGFSNILIFFSVQKCHAKEKQECKI